MTSGDETIGKDACEVKQMEKAPKTGVEYIQIHANNTYSMAIARNRR